MRRILRLGGFALVVVLVLVAAAAATRQTRSHARIRFTVFGLGAASGARCPADSHPRRCTNGAAEPAIRADGAGRFFASSEEGLFSGTDAWRSTDGGRSYRALPRPNARSHSSSGGFAPGGGDTDLAVAQHRNKHGFFNLYVASLDLANVIVSTSGDGGRNWQVNPTGAQVSGDDREWIAAAGSDTVCISYHDVATSNIHVDCSRDAGARFDSHGTAIDSGHAFLIGNNQIGNLAIDPRSHVVYEAFNGIGSAADVPCASANLCAYHAVWVGVSRNGGRSFTDYPVHVSPDTAAGFDHQFVNVSIDRGGTVYVVYSDGHDVFLSASRTRGHTWSPPHRLNSAPSRTAIFPWSAAGGRGKLDVVWYGTNYRNGSRQADLFPASARWYVYFAQVRRAAGAHPQVVQVRATPVVHRGAVCHGGITCLGDRTLYDDFGVAINPRTGLASIVFSDDQYTHSRRQPSRPGCSRAESNSVDCDHTAVATQVAGPRMN